MVEIARRDTKEKQLIALDKVSEFIPALLERIQQNLYERAKNFRADNTHFPDTWDSFTSILEEQGGFLYAHWDGTEETENKIKELTKATIRCIPLDQKEEVGTCIFSGKPSKGRVLFSKAY